MVAEFRGPGVHHNYDDSDSGYDMDMSRGPENKGRIILLGDGSEAATGLDTAMFDHDDEDKDLESQVPVFKAEEKGEEHDKNRNLSDNPSNPEATPKLGDDSPASKESTEKKSNTPKSD
jgi:protein phosphatase 2C family protein 2/3